MEQARGNGEAAAEFEISVANYPNRNNLYNLANCYRALGRLDDALLSFEQILSDFDKKLDNKMKKNIGKQIADIKAEAIPLLVATEPSGAEIQVDKNAVLKNPWPKPLLLPKGEHEISVSLKNHQPASQKVTLETGTPAVLSFTLKPDQTASVKPAPSPELIPEQPLKPATSPKESSTEKAPPTGTRAGRSIWTNPIVIVGLAGTVVMAGISAGMWGATFKNMGDRDAHIDAINEIEVGTTGWEAEWERRTLDAADEGDRIKGFNRAAVVTTTITVAFAALLTGGVLLNRTTKEKPIAVTPTAHGVKVLF